MIQKVLIAEDHESTNISIQKTLEDKKIIRSDYVYYCDDALLKIRKAVEAGEPYDLLITDLYFEKDHREQMLSGGEALMEAARELQPDLKILVFSAENKPSVVQSLFDLNYINGYVRKARGDAKELAKALDAIQNNQRHLPTQLLQQAAHRNTHEFSEFDIAVLSLMATGKKQVEIAEHLRDQGIRPSGLSSIEKRLNHIKDVLRFSTNEQMIAYCVKMGIISV